MERRAEERQGEGKGSKIEETHLLSSRASFLLSTSRVRGLRGSASDTFVLLVLPIAAPVTASSLSCKSHTQYQSILKLMN